MRDTKQNVDFDLSSMLGKELDIIVYSQKPVRGKIKMDMSDFLLDIVQRLNDKLITVRTFVLDYTIIEKLDDSTIRLIDNSAPEIDVPYLGNSSFGGYAVRPGNSSYEKYDKFLRGV